MLQTRVNHTLFAARQSYQRGILRWSWKETCITIRRDTQLQKVLLLVLLSVGDCKRLDACLYVIITNFHTELKLQLQVNHDMNFLAHYTQGLINYGQLVNHTALIRFD